MTTADLADEILACLESDTIDEALIALAEQTFAFDAIVDYSHPPFILGIAAAAMSRAYLRRAEPRNVAPLIMRFCDAIAPPGRRVESNWRMIGRFYFLNGPLIDAALAAGDHASAIETLNSCVKNFETDKPVDDPEHGRLLEDILSKGYGPVSITHDWLLDRHQRALKATALDHHLKVVQKFHANLVEMALMADKPEQALPLIEAELEWYLSAPTLDVSHFEFNAFCVFARLGRHEEALDTAKRLVRRGYHLSWRFNIRSAVEPQWTLDKQQHKWLVALTETPAYQQFLKDDLPGGSLGDEPEVNPLCLVKDDVWKGKNNRRCVVSRKVVKPGDPVVRFRKLFNRSSDGKLEIASKAEFEASPWQTNRQQWETDTVPLASLFPRKSGFDARLDEMPFIHELCFDLARKPDALDIAHAVSLIAEHDPPPISYSWSKPDGSDRWTPAVATFAGCTGHGQAVDLTWRLIKAGYREKIIDETHKLPTAKAGKVFAMLATFADDRLRAAAADFFEAPALLLMMETVFKDRLAFDDHGTLAEFGDRFPRFRAGLVWAMKSYALHLYSNDSPYPDWFLSGLDHFTCAGGSALLYFLIDHPEDNVVLQTTIDKRWLPANGGYAHEYGNATPFYVRATLFHLMRHRPAELSAWLEPGFVMHWNSMAYDR